MKVVQITESKLGSLSEYAEKMLHYGGKLMSCLEELQGESYSEEGYGERGSSFGQRMGRRGGRMGRREPMWDGSGPFPDNDPYYRSEGGIAERRGMDGRYM